MKILGLKPEIEQLVNKKQILIQNVFKNVIQNVHKKRNRCVLNMENKPKGK